MFANECAHAAAIVAGCSLDCDGACWTGLSLSVATVLLSWPGLNAWLSKSLGAQLFEKCLHRVRCLRCYRGES